MKVLLVEDNTTDKVIITAIIEDIGHEVHSVGTGLQALKAIPEWHPDIIILDVLLPDMNGTDVAYEIRQQDADDWIPIIFLSSRINPDDILAGITSGGDDYLAKPVDQVVLQAKMIAMERIAQMRSRLLNVSYDLALANEKLQQLVGTDSLTEIANRRQLEHYFATELSRCIRFKQYLTTMVIDVDYFKKYNDILGHLEGDKCLKKVAQSLQDLLLRQSDFVARYGGEEFVVILHGNPAKDAAIVAEKLRAGVEALGISHSGSPYGVVTLSIGVVVKIPEAYDTFESLIKQADSAMYRVKTHGRNGVECVMPEKK